MFQSKLLEINKLPEKIVANLSGDRLVISGGNGFLGSNLRSFLDAHQISYVAPTRHEVDFEDEKAVMEFIQPNDNIVHLAALCGGIQRNIDQADEMLERNALMGIYLFRACRKKKVKKLLVMGTPCEYPDSSSIPLQEERIWEGPPNHQTGPYGMAKRLLLYYGQACQHLVNYPIVHLIPVNLFGPFDTFHTQYGHVIPGMISRMYLAHKRGDASFPVWGNGFQTREFQHAIDASRGILMALSEYDLSDPINIGTGVETSISELAMVIQEKLGYEGEIQFDRNAPVGVSRRVMNVSKAKTHFGYESLVSLEQGLEDCLEYFYEYEAEALLKKEL